MSSEQSDESPEIPKIESQFAPTILTNEPGQRLDDDQLTPGRKNLLNWLGRMVRITLKNGLTVMGIFSCTDRDENLVIDCDKYNVFSKVVVSGSQIDKFEVNMPMHGKKITEETDEVLNCPLSHDESNKNAN